MLEISATLSFGLDRHTEQFTTSLIHLTNSDLRDNRDAARCPCYFLRDLNTSSVSIILLLMSNNVASWRPGVLNRKQLIQLCNDGIIRNLNPDEIKPDDASSINLHITDPVYRMRGSIKPHPDYEILDLIENFEPETLQFDEDETISLERDNVYIFKVRESLNLKGTGLSGQATGKSTFGRLDILTRLLVSSADSYDVVRPDFLGTLWVEITPITFPIKIKKGQSLNQLRLYKGLPEVCRINKRDLKLWGNLVFGKCGDSLPSPENLTLNLSEDPSLGNNICAFAAKSPEEIAKLPPPALSR